MRIASIDIGSNTVLLLIAETDDKRITKSLLNKYRMPRISKGLTSSNNISESKVAELFEVLNEYHSDIKNFNCEKVILTATAGFRKAANSVEISKMVKDRFGYVVETIDGDKEALYSFLGASSEIKPTKDRLIIDIGGGSTELIYGNNDQLKYTKSFPFGAVNLTEQFVDNFPVSESAFNKLKTEINSIFAEIKNYIPENVTSIAVAGTPTTLSSINKNLKTYLEKEVEYSVLKIDEIFSMAKDFQPLTPEEILMKYGEIVKGRNDVIMTGALILYSIMNILGISEIICSGKGIRYGAIHYFLNNN